MSTVRILYEEESTLTPFYNGAHHAMPFESIAPYQLPFKSIWGVTLSARFERATELFKFLSLIRGDKNAYIPRYYEIRSFKLIYLRDETQFAIYAIALSQPLEAILNPGKCFSYPLKDKDVTRNAPRVLGEIDFSLLVIAPYNPPPLPLFPHSLASSPIINFNYLFRSRYENQLNKAKLLAIPGKIIFAEATF